MGIKLSELEEGSEFTLHIHSDNKELDMKGNIIKFVKDDIALISLDYAGSGKLVFDNVQINMEYGQESSAPIMWHNVKVVAYQGDYAVQTPRDGMRHNRRDSFRVSVALYATLRNPKHNGPNQVMIKDISLSGFSITDRKKELNYSLGDEVHVSFEDIGHVLNLVGKIVRIEKHEDMIIYGLLIRNLCKDLASYVSIKQRRNKGK